MNREEQLKIFRAQTENVKDINNTWKHVQKTINHELVNDNLSSALVQTKLLALVFCAWSEANFSKLIHTPYGFELDEIQQIKDKSKGNIVDGWEKCLVLGLHRVSGNHKSNYIPNIKRVVKGIIKKYVEEPKIVRNKIAHGQWKIALNRRDETINDEITDRIKNINVVQLSIWKEAHQSLSNIIEILIESPDRAFHRDYWFEIAKIEQHLNRTKSWSLEEKIRLLKIKKSRYKHE